MAALTAAYLPRTRGAGKRTASFVAKNGSTIFPGALVAIEAATGRVKGFAAAVGDKLLGVCDHGDPAGAVGVAAATTEVPVDVGGLILENVTVTGVTGEADVGDAVYLTTDNPNDLTKTQPGTNPAEGIITRYRGSGTLCDVLIFPATQQAYRA